MPCSHVSGHLWKQRFFSRFSKKYAYTRSVFESFSSVHLKRISRHFQKLLFGCSFWKPVFFVARKRRLRVDGGLKKRKKSSFWKISGNVFRNLTLESENVCEIWRRKSSSFSILFVAKVNFLPFFTRHNFDLLIASSVKTYYFLQ